MICALYFAASVVRILLTMLNRTISTIAEGEEGARHIIPATQLHREAGEGSRKQIIERELIRFGCLLARSGLLFRLRKRELDST
jgi:hypothetical protein